MIKVGNHLSPQYHRRVIKWTAFGILWGQAEWVHECRILLFGEDSAVCINLFVLQNTEKCDRIWQWHLNFWDESQMRQMPHDILSCCVAPNVLHMLTTCIFRWHQHHEKVPAKKSLAMIRNAGSREKNTQCLTWSGYLMWKIAIGTFLLFEYDAKHFALQMCFNELIHLVIKPYCLIDLPPLCCYIKKLCIRAGWLH